MESQKIIKRLISLKEYLERTPGNNEAITKDIEALEAVTEILIEKEQRPIFTSINEAIANLAILSLKINSTTKHDVFINIQGHVNRITIDYHENGWKTKDEGHNSKNILDCKTVPEAFYTEELILESLQKAFDELAALV